MHFISVSENQLESLTIDSARVILKKLGLPPGEYSFISTTGKEIKTLMVSEEAIDEA